MDFEDEVIIQDICKSISGEEDENGNYKFEVEASNENIDLQNQITLQRALENSEEYFITNGVVSDDHQHKTRNPDGSVESHKDKIIGEPLSVRYDKKNKKTFVKGILYSGVEAAKPYIDLLKNHSSRVKASIGGIMPKIKKNADGSETVTSFMWNDLALTCSPVNWTVGSAKFAKSMQIVDFCKSLNAGSGTDAATMEGGRSLQFEDLEEETAKYQELSDDGNLAGDDKKDDLKKADEETETIKECIKSIDSGELVTKSDIESFLFMKGFDMDKARETTLEIIYQGGNRMSKSHFSSSIDELLKSFKAEDEKEVKKEPAEDEDTIDDDNEMELDDSEGDEIDKGCGVKKSLYDDDEDGDYLDATELMKSMGEELDNLRSENEELKKSIQEIQDNMIAVTKSFGDFIKTPNARQTVMNKSIDGSDGVIAGPSKMPNAADLDILNKSLCASAKKGEITVQEVQYLTSEFQKSMRGEKMDPKVWTRIRNIVKNNQ